VEIINWARVGSLSTISYILGPRISFSLLYFSVTLLPSLLCFIRFVTTHCLFIHLCTGPIQQLHFRSSCLIFSPSLCVVGSYSTKGAAISVIYKDAQCFIFASRKQMLFSDHLEAVSNARVTHSSARACVTLSTIFIISTIVLR
jgi:hypothetical protein